MVSRKLNFKQLVTLSEVYWDDAAKLREIVDALRDRLEPEADELLRTVAQRLETLRTNPAAASPSLADPPPEENRRRRWPVVLLFSLLVAAVAAWIWWPVPEAVQTATETEQGPEIQDNNEPPIEAEKPRASLPAPPLTAPRRVAVEPLSPDREPASRAQSRPRASSTAEAPAPDVKEPREAAARQRDTSSSGSAAATGARERSEAAASASAASASSGARGPAARGVAVADAQLDCYLTDNRPRSCGAPPSGGGGAVSGGAGRAAPRSNDAGSPSSAEAPTTAAPPLPVPSPTPSGAPVASAGSRSEQAAATTAAAGGASPSRGGGGGGASSGGGASESAAASAASAARRAPPKAASPGAADDPPASGAQGELPPQAASSDTAPSAAECAPAPETDRVVFILDGSVSMALPLDVDAAVEDDLDRRILRKDAAARQRYRELLAEPGPKRITRAQDAFAAAAGDLPSTVELGLMVFQECRDIRKIGIFEAARRGAAVDYVRNLVPHGRTPLADSLRSAGEMLGDGRSSIVLLTDGREFCGGDPCAAAAQLKADHPATPVHVVDITGQAKAECIADATGGRSYKPEATEDLARILRNAFRGADASCRIPSPSTASP